MDWYKILDRGEVAIAVTTDISDEANTLTMAKSALEAFGRIDVLVNNASLMNTLERRAWYKIDIDEWDQVMAANLKGAFQTAQMFSLQDPNIFNLAVEGVFDDCQDIVKAMLNAEVPTLVYVTPRGAWAASASRRSTRGCCSEPKPR